MKSQKTRTLPWRLLKELLDIIVLRKQQTKEALATPQTLEERRKTAAIGDDGCPPKLMPIKVQLSV